MLERVEALLLHPFLGGPQLVDWVHVSKMLSTGRQPGVCSFGKLCSDAETLLAISLREDPGRTPAMSLQDTILSPTRSVLESAQAAAQHPQDACREAASRICANHAAIVAFACCGRGCGRRKEEARKAAEVYTDSPTVDFALRQVVASLLRSSRNSYHTELESAARRAARFCPEASAALPPLRFLSWNVGVPRDMAAAPAAALRAHLRLHLAALEGRGPAKRLTRPGPRPQRGVAADNAPSSPSSPGAPMSPAPSLSGEALSISRSDLKPKLSRKSPARDAVDMPRKRSKFGRQK